jgi:hypothetical protein
MFWKTGFKLWDLFFLSSLIFIYNGISLRYLCILIATYLYFIKKGLGSIYNYKFGKIWLAFVKFPRHVY